MRLRFTLRAAENLIHISDYLYERNPQAAVRVRAAIQNSLDKLLLFAEAGKTQNIDGVRKLVTAKYAYLVYYTVDRGNDQIVILNVKYPAQERDFEDN